MRTKIKVAVIILLSGIISITFLAITLLFPKAEEEAQSGNAALHAVCSEYTQDGYLFGEEKTEVNRIENYSNYVNTRFDVANLSNMNADVADEWIGKIVPVTLFDAKAKNFLHIGDAYGFYFDYDTNDDTYLVYLIKHEITDTLTGQFTRKIMPLYYEKYSYDQASGRISLQYIEEESGCKGCGAGVKYYRKYSDYKKLYLKDVSFGGSLYNEYNANQSDSFYDANSDRGAFFTGCDFKAKGTSPSGKTDVAINSLTMQIGSELGEKTVGMPPDTFGIMNGHGKFSAFRWLNISGEIANDKTIEYKPDEYEAASQINYYGRLFKDYIAYTESGIDMNSVMYTADGAYVENTFYYNYADRNDKWNTLFAGNIVLSLAEATGTAVREIATDIISNAYNYIFDNDEVLTIFEKQISEIKFGKRPQCKVEFIAPVDGYYTIHTMSAPHRLVSEKGEIRKKDDRDNILYVYLLSGEQLLFEVIETEKSEYSVGLLVSFTPEHISIGDSAEIKVARGRTVYRRLSENIDTPYDLKVAAVDNVSVRVYKNGREELDGKVLEGTSISTSRFALSHNLYYIAVTYNGENAEATVDLRLSKITSITLGHEAEYEITDNKCFAFTSDMSCTAKFDFVTAGTFTNELYDFRFNLLTRANGGKQSIDRIVKNKEPFYLLLKNCGGFSNKVALSIDIATALHIGDNKVDKPKYQFFYAYKTLDLSADYSITLSDNYQNGIRVFDASMMEIESRDGAYALAANSRYYINVFGGGQSLTINIGVSCTEKMSGNIPQSGSVFIKYSPSMTAVYEVIGADSEKWYNAQLLQVNSLLYENCIYYLCVTGVPGDSFAVIIQRKAELLQFGRIVSIPTGLYRIELPDDGTYSIKLYTANGITAALDLLDSDRDILFENIEKSDFGAELTTGLYYIDLRVSSQTTVGIVISFE